MLTMVPPDLLARLFGQGLGAMLAMLVLGIPIYVCATASVPVAAALMATQGISPGAALVFNKPSLEKFGPKVRKGGMLIINSSLIDFTSERDDINEYLVPANEMALKIGNAKVANMIMLAVFVELSGVIKFKTLENMLVQKLGGKKELLEANRKAFEEGRKLAKKLSAKG